MSEPLKPEGENSAGSPKSEEEGEGAKIGELSLSDDRDATYSLGLAAEEGQAKMEGLSQPSNPLTAQSDILGEEEGGYSNWTDILSQLD